LQHKARTEPIHTLRLLNYNNSLVVQMLNEQCTVRHYVTELEMSWTCIFHTSSTKHLTVYT